MATNDPKDPTTWTPGMVAAFNAIKPADAQRMVGPGTPVAWSPDYKSEQAPGIREAMNVHGVATVNAATIAALEAVARAAEEAMGIMGDYAQAFAPLRKLNEAIEALKESRRG